MKTTLSKGAAGGSPYCDASSKRAWPGRNGLYGKKPFAKYEMQIGIEARLAASAIAIPRETDIAAAEIHTAIGKVRVNMSISSSRADGVYGRLMSQRTVTIIC
jgi:hypothetical protein